MKKYLLFLFAVYCSVTNNTMRAQAPVLTNCNPSIGDSYEYYGTNTYTSEGSSGNNQTWDFSTVGGSSGGVSNMVNPTTTANGASFTAANICGANTTSGVYTYLKTSSSKQEMVGSVSSIVMTYSNTEDLLRYPFNLNDSYVDSWKANFVSSGYNFVRKGTTTVTADAYGTLILPSGTYTDVMRIHFVQVYQDSSNISGSPYIIDYTNDEYMWYKDGVLAALAAVYNLTSSAALNPSVGTLYFGAAPVTAISEQENSNVSFTVFPNPNNGQFTVKTENGIATNCQLEVFNNVSEKVFQSSTKQFANSTIDLSALPKGLYFLKISSDDSEDSIQKLVIQ